MPNNDEKGAFGSLPVDEAIRVYIDYLVTIRGGDVRATNAIFEKYPDLFEPETLKKAKEMIVYIARTNKDPGLRDLIASVDNRAFDDN